MFKTNKGITTYQHFLKDGVYEIPGYKVEGYYNRSLGVQAPGANNGTTVEFLPQTDYLQFGLNNYVSFPDSLGSMKTIISVVNVSGDASVIYDSLQSSGTNIGIVHKNNTVAYEYRNSGKNYINGIENKHIMCSSLLNKSVIATIVNEEDTSTQKYIGRNVDGSSSAIMKLYKFLGFREALTESQIKRVIEKYHLMAGVDDIDVSGNFLNDIHYVADWDAKGRSNSEEGGGISKWIDKATGKVITLNNFSFSEMSGWNGYAFDWSKWYSDIESQGGTIVKGDNKVIVKNFGNKPGWTILYDMSVSIIPCKIRISGLSEGKSLYFYSGNTSEAALYFTVQEDGIYDLNPIPDKIGLVFRAVGYSVNEEANLVIEQLPLYPGTLVSDGVDDYGISDSIIDGEVGTIVVLAKYLDENVNNKTILNCNSNNSSSRIVIWNYSGILRIGRPNKILEKSVTMFDLTRTPVSPEDHLVLFSSLINGGNRSKCAIQRIVFIKEQLSEFQVNYLKEKIIREYEDWCIANGYDPSSVIDKNSLR